ncbi:hypothetical protein ACA689_004355 [Vibrio vulnificus]|uniref:hypothetical protein n=1 Tax=Vibrionaceae TaxID=641 RepID=UPI000D1793A0|nr:MULTISPECIES: hypothetical protein [Vibrionaceae]EGQ8941569.1 hypothetical protein [Vibrio parahaemolyticus]EGQ8948300.1 hypothetical protein [Vibrio parahaemolyticus]EGQ8967449.1 hypothetical protein [Vibrio parahaemolyticus]EGR3503220.1 hypothetical protein [Vibrio parahaemolyticus]EGR3508357.1 hypothetical protein [Vibrio parahaemolyticus]
MDFAVPEIVQNNPMVFGFCLTLSLLGATIKMVTALISFYEEVVIKRYFNRLASLSECIPEKTKTSEYLLRLKENEVFRLASGIRVPPEKSEMLIDVYMRGLADNRELKRIQRFMKPIQGKIHIETDFIDKVQILYSFCAAMFLFLFAVILGAPSFFSENSADAVAGIFIMLAMTLTAAVVGSDFRTYRTLKRIRKRLIELEMVSNAQAKLFWSVPWHKS